MPTSALKTTRSNSGMSDPAEGARSHHYGPMGNWSVDGASSPKSAPFSIWFLRSWQVSWLSTRMCRACAEGMVVSVC